MLFLNRTVGEEIGGDNSRATVVGGSRIAFCFERIAS
jgi:hypothetical protein